MIDTIIDFLKHYWHFIIIGLLIFGIFYFWNKNNKKKRPVLISREEIQRKDFINRNKLNLSAELKWLWIGSNLMGKIKSIRGNIVQDFTINKEGTGAKPTEGKEEIEVYELAYRPLLLDLGFIHILNPFSNLIPLIVTQEHVWETYADKSLHILGSVPIDLHPKADIYYEVTGKVNLKDFVTDDSIYRVDMGKMSDGYFRFTQEQSTYDAEKGHATLTKAQDIELVEKQRQKLMT